MTPKRRKKQKAAWKQRAEFMVFSSVVRALRGADQTSIDRWSRRGAALLSRVIRRRSRTASANLALAFPAKSEAERGAILKACWIHFTRMALEYLRGGSSAAEDVEREIEIVNRDYVDRAASGGRGVILISAHFGDWEVGVSQAHLLPSPVIVIARALDNSLLESALYAARIRAGVTMVERRNAARPMIETLTRGGTVILLPDQSVKQREGILVPFLGHPAWTTSAPAKMALRYGAAILPVFCYPEGAKVKVIFDLPLVVDELPLEARSVEGITARMNDIISSRIFDRPELWLWMHDRWKRA